VLAFVVLTKAQIKRREIEHHHVARIAGLLFENGRTGRTKGEHCTMPSWTRAASACC
jgi:hypothetical protein